MGDNLEWWKKKLIERGQIIPVGPEADAITEARRLAWLKSRRAELVKSGIITPRRK